jgi:hypothetical protein
VAPWPRDRDEYDSRGRPLEKREARRNVAIGRTRRQDARAPDTRRIHDRVK